MREEKMVLTSTSRVFRFRSLEDYEAARELLVKIGKGELPPESIQDVAEYDEVVGNTALKVGLANIWACATAAPNAAPYTNATALIGVGDGTTPANPDQTGLQGENQAYAPMDSGFPMPVGQTGMLFQATFGYNEAEFAWNEWCVTNTSGKPICRKVEYRGTKGPNSIWVFQIRVDLLPA